MTETDLGIKDLIYGRSSLQGDAGLVATHEGQGGYLESRGLAPPKGRTRRDDG